MKRVRLIDNGGLMVGKTFDDYAMMPPHIFLATFLPQDVSYCWVPARRTGGYLLLVGLV